MKQFEVKTQGTCSQLIHFSLEDGKIHDIHFFGGCPGNLSAISKLLEGERAEKVVNLLKGNRCGDRPTSCADQLARGVEKALRQMKTA
ncbi:MAG: TIGR03905 family TSCPD domain-containing protein [Acidaminococcus sp.]|jgi:uncharacterized protein (TIGR03905 family)|nr:TIGR03905 family TSCPD domain-containing protein [Acidaminococcus sp.]MCI2100980.1 TIGR03905 family TSCPD domain-containing protein [Acidaminococcus sp.]MCI2115323.1 TIGR03905 family TSCPD domain-containing protein [Acidaminococcus sp.]MCI2117391.1 TIGR03905 family TSCPD domain-containing protein [Acidaminococcus sp.]